MEPFHKYLGDYRRELEKGTIRLAYQGLMNYFRNLRLHLKKRFPDYFLSDVHFGQMDYTYLYFFPKTLKRHKLKVVLLFTHVDFKLQILLSGYNKDIQAKYWKLFKEKGFGKYNLAATPKEADYFLDHVLVDNPDFSDLDALTNKIETGTFQFIKDIEEFLDTHKN